MNWKRERLGVSWRDQSGAWRVGHSTNYTSGLSGFEELYPYGLQLTGFELNDPLVDVVDEAIEVMMAVRI